MWGGGWGQGGVGREKVYVINLLKNANTFTFSPKMQNSKVSQEAEEILNIQKNSILIRLKIIIIIIIITIISIVVIINN